MTSAFCCKVLNGISVGASPNLWAHGDEAQAKKVGPIKIEQKAWGIAGEAKAGDFDFACLVAGHCQAGRVGTIKVIASAK